jgi:S1-C subfamily serine protease
MVRSVSLILALPRIASVAAVLAVFLALAPAALADGWLGVQVTTVPEDLVRLYRLPKRIGAYVVDVLPGSPADRGGILPGDIMVRIDDDLEYSPACLTAPRTSLDAGRTASVMLFRGGAVVMRDVTPAEAPSQSPVPAFSGEMRQAAAEPRRHAGLD